MGWLLALGRLLMGALLLGVLGGGLGGGLGGCERDARFELFEVSAIEATRLDAGRRVTLRGSGFPVGREVEVLLQGHLHGPLRRESRVLHALRGRTVTPERVELSVTDEDVRVMGGRGTFEGALELVVHGASVDGLDARVVGRLEDVTLDVVPSERRAAPEDAGVDLAALLGLRFEPGAATPRGGDENVALDEDADDDLDDDAELLDAAREGAEGLRIAALDAGGRGAALGLDARGLVGGARIVSVDGMRVLGAEELRVDEDARAAELVVVRPGELPSSIVVDLDAARGRRPAVSYRFDQLAVIVLVATLLFGAWPLRRLPRQASVSRDGTRPYASFVTGLFALGVALAAAVLLPSGSSSLGWWLGLSLFFRVAAALGAGLDEGAHPSRTGAGRSRGDRGELVATGAAALGLVVALGAFVAANGTGDLALAPRYVPMDWPLVRSAFGPFALLTLLGAAAGAPRAIAAPTTRAGRLLRGLDDLGLALGACLFVRVSIAEPSSVELPVRAVALCASVALYAGLLRTRRSGADLGPLVRAAATTCAAACTVATALAWLELAPGPTTEQAVSEVVLVLVGLVIARVASLASGEPEGGGSTPPARRQDAAQGLVPPQIAR